MDDEFDIFDDDGEMEVPTMRGDANLDVQDYQGGGHTFLMDGLQEDTPSTPGRNPGAAPATDIEGVSEYEMLSVPGGMDAPGMKQTTFGDSPWGPGSAGGYRPYSQERTDMDLRGLDGDAYSLQDSMHSEPEVINAAEAERPVSWEDQWHGAQNQQPSNAEVDPMTLYDRTSYEYDGSTQDVIGNGIFSMEEGATWRPRDGIFANQYALPQYLAAEDELGVQQSEMWDSTAGEWRVVQPSAGGVPLARRVSHLKAYSPFTASGANATDVRQEVTGPRSHIEAFSRRAAALMMDEARSMPPAHRDQFLHRALASLGPDGAEKAKRAAAALVRAGYDPSSALEHATAHLVMHAAASDLSEQLSRPGSTHLRRLDRMGEHFRKNAQTLVSAAREHIGPLTQDGRNARNDLAALGQSPAAQTIREMTAAPPPPPPAPKSGLFTTRNVLIGGALGAGAFLLYRNRESITKNLKKMVK